MTVSTAVDGIDDGLATLRGSCKCRTCGKAFTVRVQAEVLANAPSYPFCHLILHGNPIHAHVVYIDKNGTVRGGESSSSIQIDRDSSTFQELVRWWSAGGERDGGGW